MMGWKSKNILWYILMVTIIQNGDTIKLRRKLGKNIQRNQQIEQNFFELSDSHNTKMDLKDICCKQNRTTTACTTTTSCTTTSTTTKPECVKTKKTTTCNPDKQDDDDDEDEAEITTSSYKPDWPKCQTLRSTITKLRKTNKKYIHVNGNDANTPICQNAPPTTKCSKEMLTAADNRVETTKSTHTSSIHHKVTRPFEMNKFPMIGVNGATLPPFLERYITFGTFNRIICPLLKNKHANNNNNNAYDKLHILTNYGKKMIDSNNYSKKFLLSETLQLNNVENKNETNDKNNWLHYLQERLQKGNTEYEDDKPTMNLKENGKNEHIKPITNNEDFMQYFLRNNLYNKNNQNIQSNNNNNNNLYQSKNQDNSFELNKFKKISKNKHQQAEKRNIYKQKNDTTVISKTEEENKKLNNKFYYKDYDTDGETKNMDNLDNMFANIIKDISIYNDNYLQSNNDSIQHHEVQNNKDESSIYTITTKQPLMNKYKSSSDEPNVQILNITQVFNMYSKLIPFKKYLEALHSNKWLTPSEAEKTKNYFDNENNNSLSNQLNDNELKQRIQYALIKEMLTNYIGNTTDMDQFNYNDNFYDSNALNSLYSFNRNFNFNPFLLTLPKSKTASSLNSINKAKMLEIKKPNNDNDRIVNAIKDIFKSIANNNENDDLLNIKKSKWNNIL